MSTHTLTVPFHGAALLIVDVDGQPYTPIKPIIDAIGLDWKTQYRKLLANQTRWSTMVIKTIVAADGKLREMLCLPLRKLAGWLVTISPNRVAPGIRDTITRFQNECDDVLWDHWSRHRVAPPPNALHQLPATLTPAEQQGLQELVAYRATDWGEGKGKVIAEIWSRVHRKFRVAKYDQLPRAQLPDVTAYILNMDLRTPRPAIPATLPLFEGRPDSRVLVILHGNGRFTATSLTERHVLVDLDELLTLDRAMDAWRSFAQQRELSFYRVRTDPPAG